MPHPTAKPHQPSRSHRRAGRRTGRWTAALAATAALLTLGACASTTSTPGAGPSTDEPTRHAKKAECTSEALLSALPEGATMKRYQCDRVGDTEWAAAEVEPGNTVFFLQWKKDSWQPETSDEVCGTASAGLPPSLLSYCSTAAPSASPTKTASASPTTSPTSSPSSDPCTSQKILAALPGGATMIKFTCAQVSGQQWAAARVNPGETVFFLQWNGSRWNAQDSDQICGTASAGLPQSLLSYCK